MRKLSTQQQAKLWWDEGPYSEVKIIIEDRLLDNYSSRQFVMVNANINPLTWEIANQNIGSFDDEIQGMLLAAKYQDKKYWYMVSNFMEQVDYENIESILPVLKRAQIAKQRMTQNIIQLHYFVMDLLDIKYKDVRIS